MGYIVYMDQNGLTDNLYITKHFFLYLYIYIYFVVLTYMRDLTNKAEKKKNKHKKNKLKTLL